MGYIYYNHGSNWIQSFVIFPSIKGESYVYDSENLPGGLNGGICGNTAYSPKYDIWYKQNSTFKLATFVKCDKYTCPSPIDFYNYWKYYTILFLFYFNINIKRSKLKIKKNQFSYNNQLQNGDLYENRGLNSEKLKPILVDSLDDNSIQSKINQIYNNRFNRNFFRVRKTICF